ncbi:hypothetical protein BKA82DRAFT_785640 [Pisolithus tinctorius]|uniref:Uncharacterized protein n=1 Tax=Pisolithus tinctorius Marx 270 TaxID=870435 RepID=A0A0C3PS73_PISTI|nr:hypothetical protein BKA82DRAFT_785640 [Pisolithus tinctorius]KIO11479.1 hypothetical protein M404DRAFT_785640 [Pisolithus tinctorius Marx 270]
MQCDYSSVTKRGLLIHWHKQHAEDTTSPSDSSDSSDDSSLEILNSPTKGSRSCRPSPSRRRQRASQIGASSNGIRGIPWKGRVWPYDFLDIMEDSAALNAATGGCLFLDTPDGRTGVVAHTLLPQIYKQYGLTVEWIIPSEGEEEWTLESEVRRWAASYSIEMDMDEVTAVNTGPIGCLCPDWMVEAGIWDLAYLQSAGCALDFDCEMSEAISVGV